MADSSQVFHHVIRTMALPYAPDISVTNPLPRYAAGQNCYVKLNGDLARRPGYDNYTADDYSSDSTIDGFFYWKAWDGSTYIFLNRINASAPSSAVYKLKIGTDATFVLVTTDTTSANRFWFTIANDKVYMGNGVVMIRYDAATTLTWSLTAPTAAPTASDGGAGDVPGYIRHRWAFAFGDDSQNYLTDISPLSDPISTSLRDWDLVGAYSPQTQVSHIHVYRTRDGGSILYELSNSPIANPSFPTTTWALTDSDTDEELQKVIAPVAGVNGELTPGVYMEFHVGRIWWVVDDTVYFTGLEEVNNGINEEVSPAGNAFKFGGLVTGIASIGSGNSAKLLVFTLEKIWQITGDSLGTFARSMFSPSHGTRTMKNIAKLGGGVAWLDTSDTIWVYDEQGGLREISAQIRSSIKGIEYDTAQLEFFNSNEYHWLVLADIGSAALSIFSFDFDFWFTPWDMVGLESIGVVVDENGARVLMLAIDGKPMYLTFDDFDDDGTGYTAHVVTSLLDVVDPENPAQSGYIQHVIASHNSVAITQVLRLLDENPDTGTYVDITANKKDPPYRTQGTSLVEDWYDDAEAGNRLARKASIKFAWSNAQTEFLLHGFSLGYSLIDV